MRYLLIAPIWFYRKFLSPLKPPICRFRPTCSAYAIEALQRHGAFRGAYLTVWRILRCQPFCAGGHDPVPASRQRESKPIAGVEPSAQQDEHGHPRLR